MDPQEPLNDLVLTASSVADELALVALADLSHAVSTAGLDPGSYRLIGGQMLRIHVMRWQLGPELYRETRDADLGLPPVAVRDGSVIEALKARGYEFVAGNRLARTVRNIPVEVVGPHGDGEHRAVIDVLVPAYTSRPRANRKVGELVVDEVGGLALAFRRDPVVVRLRLVRLGGQAVEATAVVPDEVAALALKVSAWRRRMLDRDAVDLWRCLEVANTAGVGPADLEGADPQLPRELHEIFPARVGLAMREISRARNLSDAATKALATRIEALVRRMAPRA